MKEENEIVDKWEYRTCVFIRSLFSTLEIEFNALGKSGWELVICNIDKASGNIVCNCVFKRKKKS